MNEIRNQWKKSKAFRVLLVAALVYAALRMAVQALLLVYIASASAIVPEEQVASDMQVYVVAAHHFEAREDLYLKGSLERIETHYLYSPAFALMFMPVLLLPLPVLVLLDAILHIAAYVFMYFRWGKIFKRLQLPRAAQTLVNLLPLWIVFTAFWDDLAYLNIYILMALAATLFIDAVLEEKLGWAIFWLGVIILPIKPQWAFAAAIPLLLGRNKFFLRLMLGAALAYFLVAGATVLMGGIEYGLRQYSDYAAFLARTVRDFPWRGPESPFLGYNHSVMQTVLYLFGVSATTMKLATLVKVILLLPLGWISVKYLMHPVNQRGDEVPHLALDFGFALYIAAFLWLDMVWEVSLGIAVFTYLLAVTESRAERILASIVFIPYCLLDFWRLLSFAVLGEDALSGAYIITDPSTYIPMILFVLLAFYAILLRRLFARAAASRLGPGQQAEGPG
jgi:hypothetical protein